jgi:hypothetical protein
MAKDPRRKGMPRRPNFADVEHLIEPLRGASKVIDPETIYRLKMPDGSIFKTTGAELLETAAASVALADADRAGDDDGMIRALKRLGLAPEA